MDRYSKSSSSDDSEENFDQKCQKQYILDINNADVKQLIVSQQKEPNFFVDFYKIVRPSVELNQFEYKVQKTISFNCWRIEGNNLLELQTEDIGFFYDEDNYIIVWVFDLRGNNEIVEKMLVYYWKGQNAEKGHSPLPPNISENIPVERLSQWSESGLFFHGFQRKFIVFKGKKSNFNYNIPHLFLFRGEDLDELHLIEIPCKKNSLRTRGSYLLIAPSERRFFYWHGYQTSEQYRKNIETLSPHLLLKIWQKSWSTFEIQECHLECIPETILNALEESEDMRINNPNSVKEMILLTPRLFYLNIITGNFQATEVEYTLNKEDYICPFPFLQSHLYSATKPAFFLLDNHVEIWLWESQPNPEDDIESFNEMRKAYKQFVKKYHREKQNIYSSKIDICYTCAYNEPNNFKALFPQWIDSKF